MGSETNHLSGRRTNGAGGGEGLPKCTGSQILREPIHSIPTSINLDFYNSGVCFTTVSELRD